MQFPALSMVPMFYLEVWKPTTVGTTSTEDPGGVLSNGTDVWAILFGGDWCLHGLFGTRWRYSDHSCVVHTSHPLQSRSWRIASVAHIAPAFSRGQSPPPVLRELSLLER